MSHETSEMQHSIIEVFGPTVQGEGALAGHVTHFIRFAGCGYRCRWCDSMHAVDPAQIATWRKMMSTNELVLKVTGLGPAPWVTLSGGDPCLRAGLEELIRRLQIQGYEVTVETQGYEFQPWLRNLNFITLSPKPPSSEMPFGGYERGRLHSIIDKLDAHRQNKQMCFKIVVFDEEDLMFAVRLYKVYPDINMYLSVGTPVGLDDKSTILEVESRLAWLYERVASEPVCHDFITFPQLHVLAWGTKQGV